MIGAPVRSTEFPRIARAIKELRLRLGETQLQFAIRTGSAISSLTRWEAGQQPKASILKAFSAIAKEHKYADLAQILNEGSENRVRMRSTLGARRQEEVLECVGAAGRLIEKSCEQIGEALKLQTMREDDCSADYRERLKALLSELAERRCALGRLADALEQKAR